ncbi:MAG: hypothetical protein IKL82_02380 [Clostridia bacterium]|nr:hypothetical protein [Clostridia bacterium]
MKEYLSFDRIGVTPQRSYYVPFNESDKVKNVYGIVDRKSSSRFLPLDGVWKIKEHKNVESVSVGEELLSDIPVPSCVQMHGYDHIQYINHRYPFPVTFPYVTKNNPCWHYRRNFFLEKKNGEKYYINFEGVDSAFYLYINGKFKGYSQISHATSEFDITDLVLNGENVIDVVVLKWCLSSYLECQDKFRFSGIFRSVYILKRPENHITDYQVLTRFEENNGVITFINESSVGITINFNGKTAFVSPKKQVELTVLNVKAWTSETPNLYDLKISANGEVIYEKVGFRVITIENRVFKINGKAVKLKGVNRHDFHPETGATVTLKNMRDDLKLMKELNVNAVRTSHYPNSPEFYALCDYLGVYVLNEADLEMHGAHLRQPTNPKNPFGCWNEYAENELFEKGITDRHIALVERDKNRPSVIIWSLGNESNYGKAFFKGNKYIKKRDKTRPVHYESLQQSPKKYYYTKNIDLISRMYGDIQSFKRDLVDNPKETRPAIYCEYTHAMGNSCGDISAYWDMIYNNDCCVGAFVWEWADHAIKTKKGYLYGGDFGEENGEHDGNFCVDGLLTPDRKIKSNALEMKAVYGGKTKSIVKDIKLPEIACSNSSVNFKVNENTGELTSITVNGNEVLKTPMKWNILRYVDNDRWHIPRYVDSYRLPYAKPEIISYELTKNSYVGKGFMCANCRDICVDFTVKYLLENSTLSIEIEYEIANYIKHLPRFGLEFGIDTNYQNFNYVGFGPTESYIDKNVACEYGYYEGSAKTNYDNNYIRPQESGSHYHTTYLNVNGLFTVTAEKPFSFSINPYTTKQLWETKHNFELTKNNFTNVCLDLGMRGIGSMSCGPEIPPEHEVPRKGKNTFKITF